MSLSELIAGVEAHEKTLTVFNTDSGLVDEFREYFADRNITVRAETTTSGKPGEFVTLSEDGEVLTATGLDSLQALLADDARLDYRERPYQPLLDHLDETMFTSWDTGQMVAASREIEDRAFRVDSGTLHAGFQYVSTLKNELPIYERLASTGVDVHAYAVPDEEPPEHDGFTLHLEQAEEIESSWFVVFDGGDDEQAACALLAEEREPRQFYGFWTYEKSTVDWILDHLESTYGPLTP
jgi:DICT domain-containing protein